MSLQSSSAESNEGEDESCKKVTSYFIPWSKMVKDALSTDECFQEIVRLDKSEGIIQQATKVEKNEMEDLSKINKNLRRKVAQLASTKPTKSERDAVYGELEVNKVKLQQAVAVVRNKDKQWKSINYNMRLAQACHDHHMQVDNFLVASSFRDILVTAESILERSKEKAEEVIESDQQVSESTSSNGQTTASTSSGGDETCVVRTKDGEEEDVDKIFQPGRKHKGGRKRKSRDITKNQEAATIVNVHTVGDDDVIDVEANEETDEPADGNQPSKKLIERTKTKSRFDACIKENELEDHSFKWDNSIIDGDPILCRCCDLRIPTTRQMKKHAKTPTHENKWKKWKKNKVSILFIF